MSTTRLAAFAMLFCSLSALSYGVVIWCRSTIHISDSEKVAGHAVPAVIASYEPLSSSAIAYVRTALYAACTSGLRRGPAQESVVRALRARHAMHLGQEIYALVERGDYVRIRSRLPVDTGGFYIHMQTIFVEVAIDADVILLAYLQEWRDPDLYATLRASLAHGSTAIQDSFK